MFESSLYCIDVVLILQKERTWDYCNLVSEQIIKCPSLLTIWLELDLACNMNWILDLIWSFALFRITVIWIKNWNLSELLFSWIVDGRKTKIFGWRISKKHGLSWAYHFVCTVKIPCLSLSMFGNLTHGNIIWSLLRYFEMAPSLSLVKKLSH